MLFVKTRVTRGLSFFCSLNRETECLHNTNDNDIRCSYVGRSQTNILIQQLNDRKLIIETSVLYIPKTSPYPI